MTMKRTARFALALTVALLLARVGRYVRAATPQQSPGPDLYALTPDQTPLTATEMHDLLKRMVANQHRDDEAIDSFERIERQIVHSGGPNGRITEDKTFRVVPTGSGTLRLLVKDSGVKVTTEEYQREIGDWQRVLNVAVHPDDPRQIASLAKQEKKQEIRARRVDAVFDTYRVEWISRELYDGRTLEKLRFEPNPDYVPRGDTIDWLTHAHGTVWIDAQAAQVERLDAEIIRDIAIGGGILGKVYHGSQFRMKQAEVAPGIWEPTDSEYDFSGRKFLFPFSIYESTLAGHYRYIGPPSQALAIAEKEIAAGGAYEGDP